MLKKIIFKRLSLPKGYSQKSLGLSCLIIPFILSDNSLQFFLSEYFAASTLFSSLADALHEECPNTEFFVVRIQENTDQQKLRIWTFSTQCFFSI